MVNFSTFAFSTAIMATMAVAAPAYGTDYKPSSSAAAYTPPPASVAYSSYGYKATSSSLAAYKPSSTSNDYKPSPAVAQYGATHTVAVGRGGLHFEPNNIVAEIGDIVEYHYLPKNHSVAQSTFGNPCMPSGSDAFFSGFMPTAEGTQNANVFQIEVMDKAPIWFYCSQTNGDHCQSGMSGVINENFSSGNTLAAYQTKAKLSGTSVSPARIGGGKVIPNPQPLAGL